VTKTDLMKSALVRDIRIPIGDLMEDLPVVNHNHSLSHVINVMRERNDKVLVRDDEGLPAGIITETNLAFFEDDPKIAAMIGKDVTIRRRETAEGMPGPMLMAVSSVTAEDVMTGPVITAPAGMTVPEAIALMENHRVNSLVVMENGSISGILKRDDIIKEVAK